MATTLGAFNDMMEQFVNELIQTFPEEMAFQKFQVSLELLRKTNPRKILDGYMKAVGPIQDRIMSRDQSVMHDVTCEFIQDLKIHNIWTPDLSDNTKNAIWQYLQTLIILGSTISALPQEALSAIEAVAKQCAESMDLSQIGSIMNGFSMPGKNPGKM